MINPDVIRAIEAELAHQERKWGTGKEQSVPGYLLVMEKELEEAKNGWIKSVEGRDSVLSEILQVVSVGISCLNAYGVSGCPRSTNDEVFKDDPQRYPIVEPGDWSRAKKLYDSTTGNHPTIHTNRFPAWDNLTATQRLSWLQKVRGED